MTGQNHSSGWSDQIRELATHSWKYAQLSQNVYEGNFGFKVTDYFHKVMDYENDEIHFFATLFKDNKIGEYILVFRGTDSFTDFKTGNNPFTQTQNELALNIFDEIKKEYSIDAITVVGHSLGGGIATHVSLNRENATSYSFNGSPVFIRKGKTINNTRYSIVENGEILKGARALAKEASQLYTSIDCSKGTPIEQHSMKLLAICLTQIAATENMEADISLKLNNIQSKYKPLDQANQQQTLQQQQQQQEQQQEQLQKEW